MTSMGVKEISRGTRLPTQSRAFSKELIAQYSQLTLDVSPIHFDEEYAKKTPWNGIIAQGTLISTYSLRLVSKWFSQWDGAKRSVSIVFVSPVRPDEEVTFSGVVTEIGRHGTEYLLKVVVTAELAEDRVASVLTVELELDGG